MEVGTSWLQDEQGCSRLLTNQAKAIEQEDISEPTTTQDIISGVFLLYVVSSKALVLEYSVSFVPTTTIKINSNTRHLSLFYEYGIVLL